MQQQPVEEIGGKTQRLSEVDEQHHARMCQNIPGLITVMSLDERHHTINMRVTRLGRSIDLMQVVPNFWAGV